MKLLPGGYWKAVLTPALLVSLFLTLTITNLDRFLPIHNDEIGILDLGYQLFHTGGYASRMYASVQHQEIIYLEVMPQMPILQGLVTRLLGVGVFQLRIIPSLAGAATVTLTYLVANKLSKLGRENPRTRKTISYTAIVSLLYWQVAGPGMPFIASGIPLLDISRIARYDGLVPVFRLASFWLWIQAHETGNTRTISGGLCSGLAMLAHLYGMIWPAVLLLFTWKNGRSPTTRPGLSGIHLFLSGAALPLLPWLLVIPLHWDIYTGQMMKHALRFEDMQPGFFLRNMLTVYQRYHLGTR